MSLFENEKLDFIHPANKNVVPSDNEINLKYVKGKIRIVTEQARYPLTAIVGMVDSGDYELKPDFQRRLRWNRQKQSRLIESFIMNVPIPPIFLYEDRFSHYEVMDGLQRLTVIYEFYNNKFTLEGLEEWAELNGRKYSQLPEQIKRSIDRRYLSSLILLYETAKDEDEAQRLKQMVFERINSGGVQLKNQESRHAIYNGGLNQLCLKLSRNPYFCRMWNIPEPTEGEISRGVISDELTKNDTYKEMGDVELVLRFFAYRQQIGFANAQNLKDYLDNYLKYANEHFSTEVLQQLEDLFQSTIKLVYNLFEEKAFYKWQQREDKGKWINKSIKMIYDPMMYVFSQYIEKTDLILQHKQAFNEGIKEFYSNEEKLNKNSTREYRQLFEQFVTNIIGKQNGR
jgi:hypothetical protein